MVDREKCIKGLHCCAHTDGSNCKYCPYDNMDEDCTALMSMDVLALLKEHEAMEPIEEFRKGANCYVYHCKRCGNIVGTIVGGKRPIAKLLIEHFCDVCGQAVKWNET